MKKITYVLVFTVLMSSFLSCDSDSENTTPPETQEPNNSQTLVSITKNSTWVNYVEVTNFADGKITDIQFSDGSYHLYTYLGGNVAQINEYDANDNVLYSKSYSYDGNGRLIYRINTPNAALTPYDYYASHAYTYDADLIRVDYKIFDFDNIQLGDTQITHLELDQNNIVKSFNPLFLPNGSREEAIYSNDNALIFTSYFSGDLLVESNYEYLNELAADAYSIGRFKFGDEWRINTLLSKDSSTLSTENIADVSLNYLSNLNYSYDSGIQSVNYTVDFIYEFDDNHLLLSQTQAKNSSDSNQTYVTVMTYEYE